MKISLKGKLKFFDYLLLIGVFALILRVVVAFPSFSNPETFLRLDSGGFLPFSDIFDWGARAPLYSILIGFFSVFCDNLYLILAIFGIVISSLSVMLAGLIGREFGGERGGICASLLIALNVTAIGVAPLILSDTLFAFLVGCQILFAVKFYKNGELKALIWAIIFGVLASLTRAVNLPIMLFGMPILILMCEKNRKKTIKLLGLNYLILLIGVAPFCFMNMNKGASFTLEYDSCKALIHNMAAIIAHAEKRPTTEILAEKMAKVDELKHNSNYSISFRNSFIIQDYWHTIKVYPWSFAVTHFPQILIMVPDLPSFCENSGITSGDRGTLSIIREQGIFAGVKHYFGDDAVKIIFAVIPLLLATLIGYIGCLAAIIINLKQKNYKIVLLWVIFSLIYVVLPGPVIMPRYHLPSLFLIFAFASSFIKDKKPNCA